MRTKGITKKGSHLKIEGISSSQFGFDLDLIEISLAEGVIFKMASGYLANL
jgi:hypothetical protein